MLLVDTNVLLDVVTSDPVWADWSQRQLEQLALRTRLAINPVVYAELSIGFQRIDEVEAILAATGVEIEEIPRPALFLAGKAFQAYRARGGTKTGVLSDFFIGAHAVIEGTSLLTRDVRRYRSYFPTITLITPGDA
ncbi:MAG: type II toxin-antitoxin system VapC family toxin [Geminicoccaceae bacterium]